MYFNNHELPELLEFSSLHVFYVFNNHELLELLEFSSCHVFYVFKNLELRELLVPSFTRLSSAIYK